MNNGITKEQSKALQGIAILMMLYHHLFSTPEALGIPYISLLHFGEINVELKMAWFFKICVGIYAFISGYGLCKSLYLNNLNKSTDKFYLTCINEYKLIIKKLWSFYTQYWLVFIIFVPIGFIFFNKIFIFDEFILNFIGLSSSYNGAWWYVYQYLKMLMILPVIDMFFVVYKDKKQNIIKYSIYGFLFILVIAEYIINKDQFYAIFNYFQPAFLLCFIIGYFLSRFNVLELISRFISKNLFNVLGIILLVFVIVLRVKMAKDASSAGLDFIFAPCFCIGSLCLLNYLKKLNRLLIVIGSYSTYMWLVHVFFYDHYAKQLVMASHLSLIIYLSLVLMSLGTAVVLTRFYQYLLRIIRKI